MISMGLLTAFMDSGNLLQQFGQYVVMGLAVVIFIESGVLFPFLPGDSLLVTAAIIRSDLGINVAALLAIAITAAFLGDQVGFWLGRRFGRRLFKDDARILKTKHLVAAEEFFAKHGPAALVLGRFVPIVRTYVPFAAGTAEMPYRKFLIWNVTGAIGWVVTMVMVGVLLGDIPGVATSIDKIMIIIVAISVLPMAFGWLKNRRSSKGEVTAAPVAELEPVNSTVA